MSSKHTADYIRQIEQQNKELDALYHKIALHYGISDTTLWILYMLSDENEVYTQQRLCQECFSPKQTINTAIANLAKNGIVELQVSPTTRRQKQILLTKKGTEMAKKIIEPVRFAEIDAHNRLTEKELETYVKTDAKLISFLQKEIEKIIDTEKMLPDSRKRGKK